MTEAVTKRLLYDAEQIIDGIERAPRMYGIHPDTVEALMIYAVEVRQMILRPHAPPDETRDAYVRFRQSLYGISTWPLWCILRDHDLLDQHARLLGDFARWILLEHPPT